jgi:CHAT domain-containing protein/tetratricopeptide (TPR) repeat protein
MPFATKLARTALAVLFLCCLFAQNETAPNDLPLHLPVQIRLDGDQPVTRHVSAHAGEYVRIVVQPEGIPLRIRLLSPSGTELMSFLNESGDQKLLPVSFIATETGAAGLEFSMAAELPRTFTVHVADRRAATAEDPKRIEAQRDFQAGKALQIGGQKPDLEQALTRFETALPLWRSIGDKAEESHTLDTMSDVYIALGDNPKAIDALTRALPLAREAGDSALEADVLTNLGVAVSFREPKKALEYMESGLRMSRSAADRNLEATALSDIGSVYILMGDPRKALDYVAGAVALKRGTGDRQGELTALSNLGAVYLGLGESHKALDTFREVLPIRRDLHDVRGEGATLYYIGACLIRLGDLDQALDIFQQALPIIRQAGDRRTESRALTNLGSVYLEIGEPQEALTTFEQDLPLTRAVKDRRQEETVLTAMAHSYVELGDPERALEYGRQALSIQREVSDKHGEGAALADLGTVYAYMGDIQKAQESYQQALPLLRAASEQSGEADTLNRLGELLQKQGNARAALPYHERALALATAIDDRRLRAVVQVRMAAAWLSAGQKQEAREALSEALSSLAASGDRLEESIALYQMARLESDSANWDEARKRLEQALETDEQIRGSMVGAELRSAYFATVLDQYDLLVRAFMELHKLHPDAGNDARAFETAERGRARTMLDLLGESRAGIRHGVDAALLREERILAARLHSKTARQIELLTKSDRDGAAAVEQEIRPLTVQYREIEARILATSPRYAAFTTPEPLSLQQVQKEMGSSVLLLEYSLGEERSFLWAVTGTDFRTFELPKRSSIEALARRAYQAISTVGGDARPGGVEVLAELSGMLLGPVAPELGNKRLVIVAPGALQYVPFAALSSPIQKKEPLIVRHEIVNLPSASTMALLRPAADERTARSKVLAVLADPVFSVDDPRLAAGRGQARETSPVNQERTASGFEGASLQRLTFTRREAENILALLPRSATFSALDFEASRATITSGALSQYRFIHIASHGLVNSIHPELSSIVLSLVDRAGHPQEGFLQTTDIYSLKLNAEMVVLSACQTALGKEVRGEGLVGLTRAFMYAGAPSVLASLWTVSDRSTAEMMTWLYQGLLVRKLRPAAALREAQIAMWKSGHWTAPYYWAAFTLQGEWR